MSDQNGNDKNRLVSAYNHMLDSLHNWLDKAEEKSGPLLEQGLEKARQAAADLGELSREDIDKISNWLKRDLDAAGNWLGENTDEFRDTLDFDLHLAESRLLDMFSAAADRTTLELKELEYQANLVGEWHTGEITGIGNLVCTECGEVLHFHKTGHIPPCPKCHGSVFKRSFD